MTCVLVYMSAYVTIHIFMFDFVFGYNVRNSHYVIKGARKLQASQITQTVTARSRLECSVLCGTSSTCSSGSYDVTSHTCFLSTLTSAEMTVYTDSDSGWSSFGVNEWLLVFRAAKGIGGNPYTSYVDATGVTTSDTNCMNLTSTSCTANYRHPVIDQWNSANFQQVKLSLYKDQAEDAYIVFNASGSDKMSWFRKERILDSSWINAATDEYNYFSIEGYTPERRFYINLNFGGCPADRLYMVALTAKMASACNFDDQPSYPQFIYANTTNPGYPESGTDISDWLLVFRAPAGIGGDVYISYVDGTDVTTSDSECTNLTTTTCSTNYRHPIVDLWNSANFEKVKVSLYKNQVEDAYIVFNGSGSTLTSWFAKEYILESSWTNATTDEYFYFSMEWIVLGRRFYICLIENGCPGDRMYMVAITQQLAVGPCPYDVQSTYPQFFYANTASPGQPGSGIGNDMSAFKDISPSCYCATYCAYPK